VRVARAVEGPDVRLDLDEPATKDRTVRTLAAERATQKIPRDIERGAPVKRSGKAT
jgi:hypothetical protein